MKMENLKESIRWVSHLKVEMQTLMQKLPGLGALAEPVQSYDQAMQNLSQQEANIAFCGKVNSGKSTLLNAVLGRNVLPTADRPLSSRIVEIENCESREKESCTLLLFDGSERTFEGIESLEKFAVEHGSDVTEVEGVELESIMLIRLRCHMPNLPGEIRLVDTPGIAASYESHGLLSYRYLKKAHAVVYVLKSDTPVMQADVPFIEKVIGANKNIIFVQSCAENYPDERVSETRARNLELLSCILGVEQNKIEYHVLSARCELVPPTGLQERRRYAALAPAFEQFMNSWRWMLCRTAGLDALEYATLCTDMYIRTNIEQMEERVRIAKNSEEGEKICLETARRARNFRNDWVNDGVKWKNHVENLERSVLAANEDVETRLMALENSMVDALHQISSQDEAKAFQKALSENIEAEWQAVQDACVERLNKCMMVLEWEVPSISPEACVRLLGNGTLTPLKLKDFGFGDMLRLGAFLLSLATGNVLGALYRGFRLLVSIGESQQTLLQRAEEQLSEQFATIRKNLKKQLESKDNPLAVFFKSAMAQSYRSVISQHNCLLEQAAAQFESCVCTAEQNEQVLNLFLGTQEKRGLIPRWREIQDQVDTLKKEISARREAVVAHS